MSQPSVFLGALLLLLAADRVMSVYATLLEPPVTEWNTLGAFIKLRLDTFTFLEPVI